ncbi:hypothetical protein ABZ897_50980 [Nonomuraea sp. NPDC046802]|uniref:hypothetical protein n=1 Tax=Nonomuraea sp. NPDC046802 TaxID=3154919 RepID=UPI0034005F18
MREERKLTVSKLWIAIATRLLFVVDRLMEHTWSRALVWVAILLLSAAVTLLSALAVSDNPKHLPSMPTGSVMKAAAGIGFLRRYLRPKRSHEVTSANESATGADTAHDVVAVTLWHNLHPDRQLGWQPHHPMAPVFTFTTPIRPPPSERDKHRELNGVLTRFSLTADPGVDHDLRRYQRSGLRPLDVGDVIGIDDRQPGQGARATEDGQRWEDPMSGTVSRWHISPGGWHPVVGSLAAHLAEVDTSSLTFLCDAYDLITGREWE